MDKIVEILLDYIEGLQNGTQISTCEVFFKVFGAECLSTCSCTINGQLIENIDFFDVDSAVKAGAKKRNLTLDSSEYDGQHIGLPYNIRYVVKKIKSLK